MGQRRSYFPPMTAIARELDVKLQTLDAIRATKLERAIRDVIDLAGSTESNGNRAAAIEEHRAHWQEMDGILAGMDWSGIERPPQGELDKREDW